MMEAPSPRGKVMELVKMITKKKKKALAYFSEKCPKST